MEPIIYALPKIDKNLELSELIFDRNPSPKLIRYGFNNINDELDFSIIYATDHYKAGLNFDFDRTDKNSITSKIKSALKIKLNKSNNLVFAEFFEIIATFDLLAKKQSIWSNLDVDVIEEVVDSYQKNTGSKISNTFLKKLTKDASLIFYRLSDVDIEENAAVHLIMNQLSTFLSQPKNSTLVLQLFGLQTQISAEIIYYLTSLYDEAYLMKPVVSSSLSNSKYLILIGLKNNTKISVNKQPTNQYLTSIGLSNVPDSITTIIQCINSDLIPKRYLTYNLIKGYLDTKVYEGATYQALTEAQDKYTDQWLNIYLDSSRTSEILPKAIDHTKAKCASHDKLMNLFAI